MIFKSNDKGELEKANFPHVDTELLILSKLEQIEAELKSINSKLGTLIGLIQQKIDALN